MRPDVKTTKELGPPLDMDISPYFRDFYKTIFEEKLPESVKWLSASSRGRGCKSLLRDGLPGVGKMASR